MKLNEAHNSQGQPYPELGRGLPSKNHDDVIKPPAPIVKKEVTEDVFVELTVYRTEGIKDFRVIGLWQAKRIEKTILTSEQKRKLADILKEIIE